MHGLGPDLTQRFAVSTNGTKVEIVTDRLGLTVRRRGLEERYILWSDVVGIAYSPPRQSVELVLDGDTAKVEIPFSVDGEDGGFDELLHKVLSATKINPETATMPATFGRFRVPRIALWLVAGVVGAAVSMAFAHGRAHWLVGALVSAMWLVTVWFGGLAKELTVTVTSEGLVLHKLLSRRLHAYKDISSIGVRLMESGRGVHVLGLVVFGRSGSTLRLFGLGSHTLETFLCLRRALAQGTQEDQKPVE